MGEPSHKMCEEGGTEFFKAAPLRPQSDRQAKVLVLCLSELSRNLKEREASRRDVECDAVGVQVCAMPE